MYYYYVLVCVCVCLGGICIQCGVNVKEARGETAFFDDDKVTRMGRCTKDIREFFTDRDKGSRRTDS